MAGRLALGVTAALKQQCATHLTPGLLIFQWFWETSHVPTSLLCRLQACQLKLLKVFMKSHHVYFWAYNAPKFTGTSRKTNLRGYLTTQWGPVEGPVFTTSCPSLSLSPRETPGTDGGGQTLLVESHTSPKVAGHAPFLKTEIHFAKSN